MPWWIKCVLLQTEVTSHWCSIPTGWWGMGLQLLHIFYTPCMGRGSRKDDQMIPLYCTNMYYQPPPLPHKYEFVYIGHIICKYIVLKICPEFIGHWLKINILGVRDRSDWVTDIQNWNILHSFVLNQLPVLLDGLFSARVQEPRSTLMDWSRNMNGRVGQC